MPVRRGLPSGLSGLMENVRDPRYSTGVGLILHAVQNEGGGEVQVKSRAGSPLDSVKKLFAELF